MHIFFSYSSRDDSTAQRVVAELKKRNLNIWFPPREISGGTFYAEKLVPAIRSCKALLLLASRSSIGLAQQGQSGSRGVRREIILADQHEKKIIPLAIDNALVDGCDDGFRYMIAERQWVDLRTAIESGDFDGAMRDIVAALDNADSRGGPTAATRLKQAELLLKRRRPDQALAAIPTRNLQTSELDRCAILRLVAGLQKRPVDRLTLAEAESLTTALQALALTAEAPAALYLLAILSRHFFEARSISDVTGGFPALRKKAASSGQIRPVDVNIIRPILPQGSRIELDWTLA